MVSDEELAWIEAQVDGDYDHLLVGTSLPRLLTRALHNLEAWDEELCSERHGRRLNRSGEWLRRAADLEHWASFHLGFERLAELLGRVAGSPDAPASVCVLSGDVHHAYVAEAHYDTPLTARVFQLTCYGARDEAARGLAGATRLTLGAKVRQHAVNPTNGGLS